MNKIKLCYEIKRYHIKNKTLKFIIKCDNDIIYNEWYLINNIKIMFKNLFKIRVESKKINLIGHRYNMNQIVTSYVLGTNHGYNLSSLYTLERLFGNKEIFNDNNLCMENYDNNRSYE